MTDRLLAWRGHDPDRLDAARVRLASDRLFAHGTSCAPDYALAYALRTGPGWVTRALDVDVSAADGNRRLELRRDDDGSWSARRWVDGRPAPMDLPDLSAALDCDLGLCPLTNTMPLLRSGLPADPTRRSTLLMAWVDVPSLDVHASLQTYGPATAIPGGGARVAFSSEGFEALIDVDGDGFVVAYPGIGNGIPL